MRESSGHDRRHGAKQPKIFSHERAAVLDDDERESWFARDDVVRLIDAGRGATIVDFGTGTGRYAIALAQQRPDVRVLAYDVQPEMLAIVRARIAELHLMNLTACSRLDDEIADIVLAANVLHEIGDVEIVALAKATKRDGAALVVDWEAAIERPTGPPADHVHTVAEARERLLRNGFTSVEPILAPQFPYHYVLRARRAEGT